MLGVLRRRWGGVGFAPAESFGVAIGNRRSALPHGITFFQLGKTKRGLKIGQVVLVSGFENVVEPGSFRAITLPGVFADAMKAQNAHAFGELRVLRGGHSTFAGGKCFRCIEGKTGDIAERSNHSVVVARW